MLAELRTRRIGTLTYVRARDDAEDVSLFDRAARPQHLRVCIARTPRDARAVTISEDDATAYDVQHYAIDVQFDPEREWISGRGSLRLKTRSRRTSPRCHSNWPSRCRCRRSRRRTFGRVLALRVSGQSGVLVSLPRPLPRGTRTGAGRVLFSGKLPAQSIDREAIMV